MQIKTRFTPDFAKTGPLAYVSAILQRPGHVAANYLGGRSQWNISPFLVLILLVSLATLVPWLLQTYHSSWAILRTQDALTPAQVASLGQYPHIWGVYSNLRQLILLPLFALPTWLIYHRQGIDYKGALFMHVLWNTAYNVYALLLFGLMAGQIARITTTGGGISLLLILIYFTAIGHKALYLNWVAAAVKSLLSLMLVIGILKALSWVGL